MIRFATITPTRGDRPLLLDFCKRQIDRMKTKPEVAYFIDYEPTSEKPDLIARVRKGIECAQADGLDMVFIVEDDDYYPADYFDNLNIGSLFFGSPYTYYYNLKNQTYDWWSHNHRSSLFRTGFRISALKGFKWPKETDVFLDIDLWKFAYPQYQNSPKIQWRTNRALGIKHGIGLTGGKGHKMTMKHKDQKFEWLKQSVDAEAFDFYKSLSKGLQ